MTTITHTDQVEFKARLEQRAGPGSRTAAPGPARRLALNLSLLLAATLACALPGQRPPPGVTEVATTPTGTAVPAAQCQIAIGDNEKVWCQNGPDRIEIANTSLHDRVEEVAVSADGERVAYLVFHDRGQELWVVDADGSHARRLVSRDDLPVTQPDTISLPGVIQWRAGTHTLFLSTYWQPTDNNVEDGQTANEDLWKVDADTGSLTQMLPAGQGGRFSLSPDGLWVAVSRQGDIALLSTDGRIHHAQIITVQELGYGEGIFRPKATWSNDSSFFVVPAASVTPDIQDSRVDLYRVNVDGTTQLLMTFPNEFDDWHDWYPIIQPSPDGRWVAYSEFDPSVSLNTTYVYQTDGTLHNRFEPATPKIIGWSPDSAWMLGYDSEGLSLMDVDGTSRVFGSGSQGARFLDWKDAQTLMFIAPVKEGTEIQMVQLDGSQASVAGPFSEYMVFGVRH